MGSATATVATCTMDRRRRVVEMTGIPGRFGSMLIGRDWLNTLEIGSRYQAWRALFEAARTKKPQPVEFIGGLFGWRWVGRVISRGRKGWIVMVATTK